MAIKRSDIKTPVLPREAVQVDALGGEVVVRGMLLRDRLDFMAKAAADKADGIALTYELMALCVVADDEKPFYTAAEWEVFSSAESVAFFALLARVQSLNGFDGEAVKKS